MFCARCGNQVTGIFCSSCGAQLAEAHPQLQLVGFSVRISDPAFEAYRKKSRSWSFLFSLLLAVIAMIAFPIYGNATGELDWPASLYYGMGIGGMFIVIAILQTMKRALDKTWDGAIEDKKAYNIKKRLRNGRVVYHTEYVIKVRKDSGGSKKHKWLDTQGLYNYYNIGDRVRHHRGFYCYEKYDKSKDSQIMCAACLAFNDINSEICSQCKCPLLK